jgi:hypothetical protein
LKKPLSATTNFKKPLINIEKKKVVTPPSANTQLLHKKKPSLLVNSTINHLQTASKIKKPSTLMNSSNYSRTPKEKGLNKSTNMAKKCTCPCNCSGNNTIAKPSTNNITIKQQDGKDTAELLYLVNDYIISTVACEKNSSIDLMKALRSFIESSEEDSTKIINTDNSMTLVNISLNSEFFD